MIQTGRGQLVSASCGSRPELMFLTGVLTKPDRIPVGDDENWLGFLRNEKGALVHNWYCVKQPNTLELKDGITWEQARQREDAFFLGPPWTTSLDRVYQKYLRTENLVKKLSVVLAQLIELRCVISSHQAVPR